MAAASSILRSATAPKHRASSRCGSYDVPLNLLLKASAQTLDVASHVDTTVWMTYGRGSVNRSIAQFVQHFESLRQSSEAWRNLSHFSLDTTLKRCLVDLATAHLEPADIVCDPLV